MQLFLVSHILLFPIVIIFAILHDIVVLWSMIVTLLLLLSDVIYKVIRIIQASGTVIAASQNPDCDILCVQIRTANQFAFEAVRAFFFFLSPFIHQYETSMVERAKNYIYVFEAYAVYTPLESIKHWNLLKNH